MNRIPSAKARRQSLRAWSRQTFGNAIPWTRRDMLFKCEGVGIVCLEFVMTTPRRWDRSRQASQPGWHTSRIGPMMVIAFRLAV